MRRLRGSLNAIAAVTIVGGLCGGLGRGVVAGAHEVAAGADGGVVVAGAKAPALHDPTDVARGLQSPRPADVAWRLQPPRLGLQAPRSAVAATAPPSADFLRQYCVGCH